MSNDAINRPATNVLVNGCALRMHAPCARPVGRSALWCNGLCGGVTRAIREVRACFREVVVAPLHRTLRTGRTPRDERANVPPDGARIVLLGAVTTCADERSTTAPPHAITPQVLPVFAPTVLTAGNSLTNGATYTTSSINPAPNTLVTVVVMGIRTFGASPSPTVTGSARPSQSTCATCTVRPRGCYRGSMSGVIEWKASSRTHRSRWRK